MAKLHATADFYAAHGRIPNNSAKDPDEKRLGVWLQNVKIKPQSAERVAALDLHLPSWRITAEDVWNGRLEYVRVFLATNGRFPSTTAKDREERKHGVWLSNQRSIAGTMDPDRLARLNDRLPGWNRTLDDLWNERLAGVVAFAAQSGRLPATSADASTDELKHAEWLHDQRRNKKLRADRESALNEHLPGWRG